MTRWDSSDDIGECQPVPSACDAVISLSQSFGYFDAATNLALRTRWAAALRQGGRVVLDVWNPDFFAVREGERELETANGSVRERKRMAGDRLHVQLAYPDGGADEFDWQLFTPVQMRALARAAGLVLVTACTEFDPAVAPSPARPRIQFVLERTNSTPLQRSAPS